MKYILLILIFYSHISNSCKLRPSYEYYPTEQDLVEIYSEVERLNFRNLFNVNEIHTKTSDYWGRSFPKYADFYLEPVQIHPNFLKQTIIKCKVKKSESWKCELGESLFVNNIDGIQEKIEVISNIEIDKNETLEAVKYALSQKPVSWDNQLYEIQALKNTKYTARYGKPYDVSIIEFNVVIENTESKFIANWDEFPIGENIPCRQAFDRDKYKIYKKP